MQAIAITAFGGLDQLKLVDLPVPPCGPGQVLINVQAAGVGMWDAVLRGKSISAILIQNTIAMPFGGFSPYLVFKG